jgi:hypothetical protein
MNLQTIKPRASRVRHGFGAGVRDLWRVSFPGSNVGFLAASLEQALDMAYRARLNLVTTGWWR